MQREVRCCNWAINTRKKNVKVWPRLPSHLHIHQNYSAKVWSPAASLDALAIRLEATSSANWEVAPIAPSMMRNFDIILFLLHRNLDIYQSNSAKVWSPAADLDALARLETTSSAKWEVAPIAPSMMKNLKNFDMIWSFFAKESGHISKLLCESLKLWSRLGRPGQAWNDQQREVGSGTWAQARWRTVTKGDCFF